MWPPRSPAASSISGWWPRPPEGWARVSLASPQAASPYKELRLWGPLGAKADLQLLRQGVTSMLRHCGFPWK